MTYLLALQLSPNLFYLLGLGVIGLNRFSRRIDLNQIPIEYDSSGHLKSRCKQCLPVGDKTGAVL